MRLVTIAHPDAGETQVPESAVAHWRSSGWEPASAEGQTAEQTLIDDAPPRVSTIANAIGYALTRRGVQVTAADVLAAAYHVVDQDPAPQPAEATVGGEETADPPNDSPGDPGDRTPVTSDQPASAPGQQAKPSARPRRQSSSKGDK